ncbi:MAG TPA: o-succinylbenzoate synthase [Acidimicrobiales bacterium]|nr:o-succinylbenzoate synthase [Acidimicrobiales bacterium]
MERAAGRRHDGRVKIEAVELRRLNLPLVREFRTSFGTETTREALVIRVLTNLGEGWGECGAGSEPLYSSEYVDGAWLTIRRHLVPRLAGDPELSAADVGPRLSAVKGHRMAKSALEMALLDAELRAAGMSFSQFLGGVSETIAPGVSMGITASIPELLEAVAGYLDDGYCRVKLKIQPGWDVAAVQAVREHFGDDLLLQVDANTAYRRSDLGHLARLDDFGLLLIEQPFDEEDLLGHAELARRVTTPICLDESIVSARSAATAIALGACSVVNIKASRVGGYLEARAVHDVCAAHGVPVWCGGMLETGIGRAANLALAALPGFLLPGDVSATARYYREDITPPFLLTDGHITVPSGPGLGVEILPASLAALTRETELITV